MSKILLSNPLLLTPNSITLFQTFLILTSKFRRFRTKFHTYNLANKSKLISTASKQDLCSQVHGLTIQQNTNSLVYRFWRISIMISTIDSLWIFLRGWVILAVCNNHFYLLVKFWSDGFLFSTQMRFYCPGCLFSQQQLSNLKEVLWKNQHKIKFHEPSISCPKRKALSFRNLQNRLSKLIWSLTL